MFVLHSFFCSQFSVLSYQLDMPSPPESVLTPSVCNMSTSRDVLNKGILICNYVIAADLRDIFAENSIASAIHRAHPSYL